MGNKVVLLLCAAVFFSCLQNDKKPDNVLSEREMVKVLAEVYIAEQKVAGLALPQDSALKVFGLLQNKVFESTGVPDSVLKKSIDYYMEHPKEFEQIYSVLVDSLQLREQRTSSTPQ